MFDSISRIPKTSCRHPKEMQIEKGISISLKDFLSIFLGPKAHEQAISLRIKFNINLHHVFYFSSNRLFAK